MRKLLLLAGVVAMGCDQGSPNVLGGVSAIAYLVRTPAEPGNVFDYRNGGVDDNVYVLAPPTASGLKTNLTNWSKASINSFDLSFDARELVISAQAPGDDHYHLYRVNVDGTNPCDAATGKVSKGLCQITEGAFDQVYPIYLPGGRIYFDTNENVEGTEVPQFHDEYERATTAQAATCAVDGSSVTLGPRNVSHRVAPSLLSDGRVVTTQWDHMGEVNDGNLMLLNQDMTSAREGFGKEGKGITNSYLRAREVSPGKLVTIGTSRDRTFQAGKILLVDLGGLDITSQSEARSSAQDLTPDVPGDRQPSYPGVGRYYDAFPVGTPSDMQFLVSWADGPVETEIASMAKAPPDFGIYLYDAKTKTRHPIVNGVGTWETSPIAIVKRAEPTALATSYAAVGTQSTLMGAVNVNDSTRFTNLAPGAIKKVRVTEGFSTEEGFPNMFGLTEFDGQARLGEADVNPDGSFKALVPANTPIRLQLIDKYGMAATVTGPGGDTAAENIWIQGRPGEARMCGGCHEDRTKTLQIQPGSSALQAVGAAPFDYPTLKRQERKSDTFTYDKVMGVPWDKALQPIFDRACTDCHDGSAGAANPSYSLTDLTDMVMFSFTFDLTSKPVTLSFGDMVYTYSASHVSLMGPSMALREKQVMVTMGELKSYVEPGSAHNSQVIQMLNPPARFPAVDTTDRAFAGKPIHPAEVGTYNGHNGADAKYQLSADEYYLLILSFDAGGQYYSRENAQGGGY